jgi:hypothetical protein
MAKRGSANQNRTLAPQNSILDAGSPFLSDGLQTCLETALYSIHVYKPVFNSKRIINSTLLQALRIGAYQQRSKSTVA